MCQLCKHYGRERITTQRTLRTALEEARAFFASDDDEMKAHIDALIDRWFFGRATKRDKDVDEAWERGHR